MRIAFIGLGVMGGPMAGHLQRAGHDVCVFNRTASRADAWVAEYGGSAISVVGNNVFGTEGNGTVMFSGTYSSLSWTNPTSENWYGFNVGMTAAVPEPETYALLLAGLGVIGALSRRRRA